MKKETKTKAKKNPQPKVEKKAKGPGVITTIRQITGRANGVTKEEVLKELKKLFPDREELAMGRTFQIKMSRIPSEDKTAPLEKREVKDRGFLYYLKTK